MKQLSKKIETEETLAEGRWTYETDPMFWRFQYLGAGWKDRNTFSLGSPLDGDPPRKNEKRRCPDH